MRVLVLDYTDNTVNVLKMDKKSLDKYNMDEDFDAYDFISLNGFDPGNCNWMFFPEDEIPVYWGRESSIPYTSI